MNNISILKSKLIMPELSKSFLLTDRLKRLHKDMDSHRVITVCAPAGYGKTTLTVSYFNHQAALTSRICWYRLEPEDKNLSVFITHLVEAMFPSGAAEFAEARKALEDYADMQPQPHHTISMLCQEMWAHHDQSSDTLTYIVLDDFQNVAQVQDICDITRFMLDNLPPSCVIFILSRTNIIVFTERQKLEKNILEIATGDLAFNKAEIEDLMLSMNQTVPDRKLMDIIVKNTEGWIAGIIILSQAAKSKGSGIASIKLDKQLHDDALFRYMSIEVLKSIEGNTQDVLARLAMLQDFSEVEASEILGINSIQKLMEQCIGFGMFIQRIPGNPVVYRFHSLFREFLLYILKSGYSGEQISELHLKAAGYYIGHMLYIRAAEHLTKCGNSAATLDMVTKVGFERLMIGEAMQLKVWLDMLPEDVIRDNPVLLMYKTLIMPNRKHIEVEGILRKVLELSLSENNLEIYSNISAILIDIYMCNNNMAGILNVTSSIPNKLQGTLVQYENTLSVLEMIRSIGEDRLPRGEAQSESILYSKLSEDFQWHYLCYSCIIYYCLGKLDHAERCMKTALNLDNFKHIELARGYILLFLTIVLSLKNEKERLPSLTSEIIAIGEKYDYEFLSAYGNRLAAFERYLSLDAEVSIEMLDYAVFYFHQIGNKAMAAACKLLQHLWSSWHNSSVPNLDEARKDIAVIRKARPGMMVFETSLSIFGAIAREAGDYQLAERCLLSSIKSAKAKKGDQVLCGSCFHIARLYFASGNAEQGHLYLKQAIDLAAGNRYYMFWDIHIPTLTEMTLRSIRYGYCADFAGKLLGKYYNSDAVKYLIEKAKTIDENRITAFTISFVSTYKADQCEQLYFVKASLFGKPEIYVNGVKIPDTEWKTKKIKGLLEYLLLNSGKTVSKETLAEILWPESDGKSAIISLRTALHYLKKTLSKYNVEILRNNSFIHETLEGLQIRNNDVLELDIHEFLHLHGELSGLSSQTFKTEHKQAKILERMISLYNGDLMEGSDYGDLVFLERERCKSIFVEACQKLSSIYIKCGEFHKAEEVLRRAYAVEPFDENVCLELLKLFMSQGRTSKAVKLYYSFKKRIEQELDIKVDKRLTEAIQRPRHEK